MRLIEEPAEAGENPTVHFEIETDTVSWHATACAECADAMRSQASLFMASKDLLAACTDLLGIASEYVGMLHNGTLVGKHPFKEHYFASIKSAIATIARATTTSGQSR